MDYSKDFLLTIDLTQADQYQAYQQFLRNSAVFELVTEVLRSQDFFKQWYAVNPKFKEQFPERVAEIDTLLAEGRWMVLQALTEDQVKELFHNRLNILFNIPAKYGLDSTVIQDILVKKLAACITSIYPVPTLYKDRDALKRDINQVLIGNEEIITTAPFYHPVRSEPATTKNWFAEYIEYIGGLYTDGKRDQFFAENENFKRLIPAEQEKVKTVFDVYERLRRSSASKEGLDEELEIGDGGETALGVLHYGTVEYYSPEIINQAKSAVKTFRDIFQESNPTADASVLSARPPVDLPVPMVGKGPNVSATAGPDHFTDNDAAEIARLASQTDVSSAATQPNYAADIQAIQQKLSLTFSDAAKGKQFADGVESALRGLRDPQELTHYLEKLGLTILQISQTVFEVKKILGEREQANRPKLADVERLKPTFADAKKTMSMSNGKQAMKPVPAPVVAMDDNARDGLQSVSTAMSPQRAFLPKLRRPKRQRKPMIDDVKLQQSMVMGPIDELRAMDVIEFRRLATDAATATLKIKDKISLLGEESIDKQTEGIKAFKESPLNHLYLDIGSKSITTNQAVAEVITNLQAQNVPTLSLAEFNAIADLNQQLRF